MARRGRRANPIPPVQAPVPAAEPVGGQQMFNEFMNAFTNAQGQNVPNQGQNDQSRVVKQFRSYNPPVFNGQQDPSFVEKWIRSLERIFKLLNCTDAQRVDCAEYQLEDAADHWWEGVWRDKPEEARAALT